MDTTLNARGTFSRGPVRLLVVNPSPIRGGAEQILLDLARLTDPTRLDVIYACLAPGPFVDELVATGARVVRFQAGRLRYPWAWARVVADLARLARRGDAVFSWQVKGHYYGTPAARMARTRCAWWDHGIRPSPDEPRYTIDARLPALVPADRIVCSSAAAAARHRAATVIHPGIDLGPFETPDRARARSLLGIPPGAPLVGIVGRLQPWKGQEIFLRAAAVVANRIHAARFVVVGGTPGGFSSDYPAYLERLARDLAIGDRVTFLGQRDDVAALLPGLDVFVNASDAEPFGIGTVEAMAAGVPVVAARAGGTPEIIRHKETGLLVPPGDPASFADEIESLLDDREFAGMLAAAGRARAFEQFGAQRMVNDITRFVEELAG